MVTSKKLGKMVSTLQSTSGPMPKGGFGFATEADADSFTIDTQYYLCTELNFAEADPHFSARAWVASARSTAQRAGVPASVPPRTSTLPTAASLGWWISSRCPR